MQESGLGGAKIIRSGGTAGEDLPKLPEPGTFRSKYPKSGKGEKAFRKKDLDTPGRTLKAAHPGLQRNCTPGGPVPGSGTVKGRRGEGAHATSRERTLEEGPQREKNLGSPRRTKHKKISSTGTT